MTSTCGELVDVPSSERFIGFFLCLYVDLREMRKKLMSVDEHCCDVVKVMC